MTAASKASRPPEQDAASETDENDTPSPAWAILYQHQPNDDATDYSDVARNPTRAAPRMRLGAQPGGVRRRRVWPIEVAAGLTVAVVVVALALAWPSRRTVPRTAHQPAHTEATGTRTANLIPPATRPAPTPDNAASSHTPATPPPAAAAATAVPPVPRSPETAANAGTARTTPDGHPAQSPEAVHRPATPATPQVAKAAPPASLRQKLASDSSSAHPAASGQAPKPPVRAAASALPDDRAPPPVATAHGPAPAAGPRLADTLPPPVSGANPAAQTPPPARADDVAAAHAAQATPPPPGRVAAARSTASVPATSTPAQTLSAVRLPAPSSLTPVAPASPQAALAPVPPRPPPPSVSKPTAPKASLIVIATGKETLAALYRKIYRGLTPPAFTTVAALNPQRPKRGDVLTFPPPADGWRTDRSSAARQ